MWVEYAVLERGEIINVVSAESRERADHVVRTMAGVDLVVVPLDSLPLGVKQRYRFWNKRP